MASMWSTWDSGQPDPKSHSLEISKLAKFWFIKISFQNEYALVTAAISLCIYKIKRLTDFWFTFRFKCVRLFQRFNDLKWVRDYPYLSLKPSSYCIGYVFSSFNIIWFLSISKTEFKEISAWNRQNMCLQGTESITYNQGEVLHLSNIAWMFPPCVLTQLWDKRFSKS